MSKARVPQVGEKLHFFDDGKVSDSRHYLAVVTHVLTPEQAKRVYIDARTVCENHTNLESKRTSLNLLDIHSVEIKNCDWLFADQTDYFIGCAIPEYDDHIIWFVRTKHGDWFSMDVQTNWQSGRLDVDGEYYQRMIDEGYKYTERI